MESFRIVNQSLARTQKCLHVKLGLIGQIAHGAANRAGASRPATQFETVGTFRPTQMVRAGGYVVAFGPESIDRAGSKAGFVSTAFAR